MAEQDSAGAKAVRDGALEHTSDGKTWLVVSEAERHELVPLIRSDYQEVLSHLRKLRPTPDKVVRLIAEAFNGPRDQALRQEMLDRAYKDLSRPDAARDLSDEEISRYLDTEAGTTFGIWLALRKSDPKATLEGAESLFWKAVEYAAERRQAERLARLGLRPAGTKAE